MSTVELALHEGVATLTLSRPECKNALNGEMCTALLEALTELQHDPQVGAVVLRGAGDDFCSGGDMGNMSRGGDREAADVCARMFDNNRVLTALAEFDRPVIAAVDGIAFGAGFSLALAADFIVASQRARLCMAFARLGAVPDLGATYTLPRVVGLQKARELIYSARELSAEQALQLGIVMEVLPAENLHRRAHEIASSMTKMSPIAFAMTKRLLDHSLANNLASQLNDEACAQSVALTSAYLKNAAAGFMRKQPLPYRWPHPQQD